MTPKSVSWAPASLELQILIFRSYQTSLLTCPMGSSNSVLKWKLPSPFPNLNHCQVFPIFFFFLSVTYLKDAAVCNIKVLIQWLPRICPALPSEASHIVGIQVEPFMDSLNK